MTATAAQVFEKHRSAIEAKCASIVVSAAKRIQSIREDIDPSDYASIRRASEESDLVMNGARREFEQFIVDLAIDELVVASLTAFLISAGMIDFGNRSTTLN
jgi:hypothetical protein